MGEQEEDAGASQDMRDLTGQGLIHVIVAMNTVGIFIKIIFIIILSALQLPHLQAYIYYTQDWSSQPYFSLVHWHSPEYKNTDPIHHQSKSSPV